MPKKKPSGTPSAASSTSGPPERLTVFLDESVDNDSIYEALLDAGVAVERLTAHLPKGTTDDVWLTLAGGNNWIVFTRDKRIRYRQLERLALRAAQVCAFVFTGGNVTMKETAEILAQAIPDIREICAREPGPFVYHIGRAGNPRRMD